MNNKGWNKKFKGSRFKGGAFIYTHPEVDWAIVYNHHGPRFRGILFSSVEEAMDFALREARAKNPIVEV